MPPETLANRVAILEHKMQSLEGLPDRVAALEVQILQFRAEVRAEFSAVRQEMRALGETLRFEMNALAETLRGEMNGLGDTLRGEMNSGINGLAHTLRAEIRAGDEETRLQMRVLHEEVIARFALLDDHLNGRKRSPKSRGRADSSRPRPPKR